MSWIRYVALVSATLISYGTSAQQSLPLVFADAARKTIASHPQLEQFSLAIEAATAQTETAALKPPLEVLAEAENVAGSGALSGADSAEITLSLSSVFERGGKRDARRDAADRMRDLLTVEQRVEMLDLLAETGRRFVAVAVAQESVALAEARADQARRTLDLIIPRVAAARSPRTEQLNVEIEVAAAQLAAAEAQRTLETARLALAAQWAAPHEAPVVSIDLRNVPEPRTFDALVNDLERLPDLERFAAETRVREAEVRLVRAQMFADLRWSAGVRRIEGVDEQALVLGFSMPLFSGRRATSLAKDAELVHAQASLGPELQRLKLLPVLHAQWQQLRSERATVRVITDEQLPRAREALELTERGYNIGRFPYRELALSQQQVLALEAQSLDALAHYHLTRIEIERLTGAQLPLLEGPKP
jgi:outer membrane protein, heavy metal efflux system